MTIAVDLGRKATKQTKTKQGLHTISLAICLQIGSQCFSNTLRSNIICDSLGAWHQ